jgi:hypothetical protein
MTARIHTLRRHVEMKKVKFVHKVLIILGVLLAGLGLLVFLTFKVYGGPTIPGIGVNFETAKRDMDRLVGGDFSMPKFSTQIIAPDALRVFLKDGLTSEQTENLKNFIKYMPEVEDLTYISKDQAAAEYKEMNKEDQYLIDQLDEYTQYYGNPLPAEFRVKLGYGKAADPVIERVKTRSEISEDENGEKAIEPPSDLGLAIAGWNDSLRLVGSNLDTWLEKSEKEMINTRRLALWAYVGGSFIVTALFVVFVLIRRRRIRTVSSPDSA